MLSAMTPTGAFGFYAGLNIVALATIFLFVPETKQRTLEELDYIFAIPTRRLISHQCGTVSSWWLNTYMLRRKARLCPALWSIEGGGEGDKEFEEQVRRASIVAQGGDPNRRRSSLVEKITHAKV